MPDIALIIGAAKLNGNIKVQKISARIPKEVITNNNNRLELKK